jgi:hypothetical protein
MIPTFRKIYDAVLWIGSKLHEVAAQGYESSFFNNSIQFIIIHLEK